MRVALAVTLLLATGEALARVGGGEGYGRPSGGGGGGGGGDEGLGDLLFFLIWLCIEFPLVGIPLLLVVVGVVIVRMVLGGTRTTVRASTRTAPSRGAPRRRPGGVAGLDALAKSDPGFSLTVLLDLLVLVHRRAWEAASRGGWEALAPYLAPSARTGLVNAEGWTILEVVPGAIKPYRAEVGGAYTHLHVRFETTRLERSAQGREQRFLVEEDWTFRRKTGATTRAPELVARMGCPSCGNSVEARADGTCPTCGTPIAAGELEWQAHAVQVLSRIPVEAPKVSLWTGGDEVGVSLPTVADPGLSAAARALLARHPDFDQAAFLRRVDLVFHALQLAWSEGRWHDARPFVTDPLFQTLRFQMERYTANGLRNRLDDVALTRSMPVKVATDAWYESITVRLWGQAKDSVVRVDTGEVVGGNPKIARKFSEYWTFVRAAGTGGAATDQKVCPSCGAPLDNVNAAGIRGYCDGKITSGRFDWVLSRIEQAEAYQG